MNLDHNDARRRRSRIPAHALTIQAADGKRMWTRVFCCAYGRACERALGVGVGRGRGRWAWAWRVWALAWALAWALGVGVGVESLVVVGVALGVGVGVGVDSVCLVVDVGVAARASITQNVYMDRHPVPNLRCSNNINNQSTLSTIRSAASIASFSTRGTSVLLLSQLCTPLYHPLLVFDKRRNPVWFLHRVW